MSYNVGLEIQEKVAEGISPFREPAKRNIGVIFARERGKLGEAIPIFSEDEDLINFGTETTTGGRGFFVMRNFLKNVQNYPFTMYCVRIAGAATAVASGTATMDGKTLTATAGNQNVQDKGDWANGMQVKIHSYGQADPKNWVSEVIYKGKVVETLFGSTLSALIAEVSRRSNYFILSTSADILNTITATTATITLANGVYAAPVEADFQTALSLFDTLNVQLIANTEFNTNTSGTIGKSYVEGRKDCMYLHFTILNPTNAELQTLSDLLVSPNQSWVAIYNIWAKVSSVLQGSVIIPAIGHVLGAAFIRTPAIQGDYVHIPPAGIDSSFNDYIDIYPKNVSRANLNLWTKSYYVNTAKFSEGRGYYVATSRTVSSNKLYHSIHIRMFTNYLVKALEQNLDFALQKPISKELNKQMQASLNGFFRTQYENGALLNTLPFNEVCKIVVGKPTSTDRKVLNVTIEYVPTEVGEAVVLFLNRADDLLNITE